MRSFAVTFALAALAGPALAQAPTSSLLIRAQAPPPGDPALGGPDLVQPHGLRAVSMFAVQPAEARIFQVHDLIQIVVRETSTARSRHALETEKDWALLAEVDQWPNLNFDNLFEGWLRPGNPANLPGVEVGVSKDFNGDGDYARRDDFTARLTAEVLQVLPNGNLILESRTRMKQDDEEFVLKVTGICRSEDVTAANLIQSSQLHDLKVEKVNKGELKKANERGILAKILDTIFAF
jgi:flagellar L-ring protein precursor FlgH